MKFCRKQKPAPRSSGLDKPIWSRPRADVESILHWCAAAAELLPAAAARLASSIAHDMPIAQVHAQLAAALGELEQIGIAIRRHRSR